VEGDIQIEVEGMTGGRRKRRKLWREKIISGGEVAAKAVILPPAHKPAGRKSLISWREKHGHGIIIRKMTCSAVAASPPHAASSVAYKRVNNLQHQSARVTAHARGAHRGISIKAAAGGGKYRRQRSEKNKKWRR